MVRVYWLLSTRLHYYNLEMGFRSSCLSHAVTSPVFLSMDFWMGRSLLRDHVMRSGCAALLALPETP